MAYQDPVKFHTDYFAVLLLVTRNLEGMFYTEASRPIITPSRQTQENSKPTKDSTRAQDSCKVNCECLKDENIKMRK